jgi:hypothetical protein
MIWSTLPQGVPSADFKHSSGLGRLGNYTQICNVSGENENDWIFGKPCSDKTHLRKHAQASDFANKFPM